MSAASSPAEALKSDAVKPDAPKPDVPASFTPVGPMVLAGLMSVMAMAVIESNIVNTSLSRIVGDLGGMSRFAWVVTAFLLASTIAAPLYGKLSDLYGRRRLMTISIVIFLAGSMLCGIAGTMLQLVVFRAVQGLGAGGLVTLVQATIGDLVAPSQRARYQTLFTVVFAAASLAGPLLGGALTTYLSWRWIFFVNLPIGAVALVLILSSLPALQIGRHPQIDFVGAGLLTICTTALMIGFGSLQGRAINTVLLAMLAAVSLWALIRQERRAAEPIIDLQLFANRIFVIGVCVTATMAFALFSALLLIPLYLQLVAGETPIGAAMIVTPQIAGMVIASFFAARFATNLSRVPLLLVGGVVFDVLALWGLVIGLELQLPTWSFSIIAFMLGAGMGLGMPNATAIVQNAVRRDQMGVATGSLAFFRSLGGAAGVALSGGVVSLVLRLKLQSAHLGVDIQALIDHGTSAAGALAPAQHAEYIGAYARAIQSGLALSALVITGTLGVVLFLPAAVRHARDRAADVSRGGASLAAAE